MKYQFEEFTQTGRKASSTPLVSITRAGNLNLNQAFMEAFVKGEKYCILYYDKTNEAIGLKLTNEKKHNSYSLRSYRGDKIASITAIAFLKYHGIPFGKGKHSAPYEVEWSEENQMIIVDLNKPIK